MMVRFLAETKFISPVGFAGLTTGFDAIVCNKDLAISLQGRSYGQGIVITDYYEK